MTDDAKCKTCGGAGYVQTGDTGTDCPKCRTHHPPTDDAKWIARLDALIAEEDELIGMSDFDVREAAHHARDDRAKAIAIAKRLQAENEWVEKEAVEKRGPAFKRLHERCANLLANARWLETENKRQQSELERLRPVVEAARDYVYDLMGGDPCGFSESPEAWDCWDALVRALDNTNTEEEE